VLDATVAVKDEQPRTAALCRRMLCDERIRQLEVEIGDVHSIIPYHPGLSPARQLALSASPTPLARPVANPLQFSRRCSTSSLSGAARPD
jgi:hypothetical protein